MARETERKFIVTGDGWKKLTLLKKYNIEQGYIHSSTDISTRVRLTDDEAWLTIKANGRGITRDEFEYSIPHADGTQLIKKAPKTLKKIRHYLRDEKNQVWEVDIFRGLNRGLILVEIELPSTKTRVEIPDWVGREVSTDAEYFNTYLVDHKVARK